MWENYELSFSSAQKYKTEIDGVAKTNRKINEIKNQIKDLGSVNLDAIEEYKSVKQRYEFLVTQRDDLLNAKLGLENIIAGMTAKMRKQFKEQFDLINREFSKTFAELFGGGKAEVELTGSDDVLQSDIEIKVQPPGKNVRNLSLLSGGEQAFVAIALLFAILKIRPTPFCVFDEIEAALDDVNVNKFAKFVRTMSDQIQFVIITHRRGTMELTDLLYGVTMQEYGVSKLLAINISDVEKRFKLK